MTRKMPWFKRFPSNCISGMLGLTLEEKGLYNLFIDLCYDRGGPIEEDQAELARMAGCGPRMFRRVRDALIVKEKLIRLEDGKLIVRAFRAGAEGHADAERPENGRETAGNGAAMARKTAGNGAETAPEIRSDKTKSKTYANGLTRAGAGAPVQMPESRNQTRTNGAELLCEELGIAYEPNGNQANWQSILERMIREDGIDFDHDVLGAVRNIRKEGNIQPGNIRTPAFFRHEARRLCDLRHSGKPSATVHVITPKVEDMSRPDWARRLARFLDCGIWIGPGPDPTIRACIAPPDMLAAARARWAEQGDHPEFADTDCNFRWQPEGPRMRGVIWPAVKAVELEEVKSA